MTGFRFFVVLCLVAACGKNVKPTASASAPEPKAVTNPTTKDQKTLDAELVEHRKTLSAINEKLGSGAEIETLEGMKKDLEDSQFSQEYFVQTSTRDEAWLLKRKIEAELLEAHGNIIVTKLRLAREKLYATVGLAYPPKPDLVDELFQDDPAQDRAARRSKYIKNLEAAEGLYWEILERVAKYGLRKKLYVEKDGKFRMLFRKQIKEKSMSVLFFMKTELDQNLDEEFLSTLGVPRFFQESNEYDTYDVRIKAWPTMIQTLRDSLKIEMPIENISSLIDLI